MPSVPCSLCFIIAQLLWLPSSVIGRPGNRDRPKYCSDVILLLCLSFVLILCLVFTVSLYFNQLISFIGGSPLKWDSKNGGSGGRAPIEPRGKVPGWGRGAKPPEADDIL